MGEQLLSKVALVTGAASGIGRATALRLASEGADIAALDIDANGLDSVRQEITERGRKASAVNVDLGDSAAIPIAVDDVLREHGRIDILVNVAGIAGEICLESPVLAHRESEWDRVMGVNLKAPFLLVQHVGRHMVERGSGGRIVNVSSSSAFRALNVSNVAYPCSKLALLALTRVAAGELGPYDINVNMVAPGLTDTAILHGVRDRASLEASVSIGPMANLLHRVSEAEDVAGTIVFLCLPDSRQITGQTLHTSAGAVL